MDQVKSGEFIAQKRKELGITQRQLAEQLGVSDKTISKWECGKSMPDYSIMQSICQILQVSVNELLAGETLMEADYKNRAEETIINLMEQKDRQEEKSSRSFIRAILGLAALVLIIGYIMLGAGGVSALHYIIDFFSVIVIVVINFVMMMLLRIHKDFWRGVAYFFGGKKDITGREIRKSILAMKAVVKTTLLSGIIVTVSGIVVVGYNFSTYYDGTGLAAVGPSMAVSVLGIFYGCILGLIVYMMQMKLELSKEE